MTKPYINQFKKWAKPSGPKYPVIRTYDKVIDGQKVTVKVYAPEVSSELSTLEAKMYTIDDSALECIQRLFNGR